MRDSVYSSIKLLGIVLMCLALSAPDGYAWGKKKPKKKEVAAIEQPEKKIPDFLKMPESKSDNGGLDLSVPSTNAFDASPENNAPPEEDMGEVATASSGMLLQGKTEKTHIVLEDQKLYQVAMNAIKNKDYAAGIRYLQMLTPQFDKPGYEPYIAQIMYYEAGCHKGLKRMNAALDMYNKAYDLFAKYDSSNPLKGKAWKEYEVLRAMNGKMDTTGGPLTGNVQSAQLRARIKQRNLMLELQKAQFAIDPNVTLKANASKFLLRCNDEEILPKIVLNCFAEMSCLETAEIGSNVSNAVGRWMPLKISGRTAAFSVSGQDKPCFRARVNGRSYLFDINLPGIKSGLRKILVVTNLQKICAVDVDTYDTWLLRMKRRKDGVVTGARWFKLTHKKKFEDRTKSSIFERTIHLPTEKRAW